MRQILFSTVKILISAAQLYLSLRNVNVFDRASRISIASLSWIPLAIGLLAVDLLALAVWAGFLPPGSLLWSWLKRWWGTHNVYACAVIANRVLFSRDRDPKVDVLSSVVSSLPRSRGAWQGRLPDPCYFSPTVLWITMLPMSKAGWGACEATMGSPRGTPGLAANEGVNILLLIGAVSFIVGAVGGLVSIMRVEKEAQAGMPIQVPEQFLPRFK